MGFWGRCIHLLFPFNLPAIMSKTVPLKTTESEEQEPVLPSTINMPSTSHNTDVFEINDEFCSFDIMMPQEAVALKIGEPEESVRSAFPLFLSRFHLSVCAMQITYTDQFSSNLVFHLQKKPDALTQQKN